MWTYTEILLLAGIALEGGMNGSKNHPYPSLCQRKKTFLKNTEEILTLKVQVNWRNLE